MTRDEAIERMKIIKDDCYIIDEPEDKEAFEMAISALEQEPTDEMVHVETLRQVKWERDIAIEQLHELGYELGQKIESCDDAISREAVYGILMRSDFKDSYTYEQFKKWLDALPSVQPSRKGHWIPIPYQLDYKSDVKCSECGAEIINGDDYKCCPYCFADMRGAE